jgi:hypothetical protein
VENFKELMKVINNLKEKGKKKKRKKKKRFP